MHRYTKVPTLQKDSKNTPSQLGHLIKLRLEFILIHSLAITLSSLDLL
jgi:hypothetical protein